LKYPELVFLWKIKEPPDTGLYMIWTLDNQKQTARSRIKTLVLKMTIQCEGCAAYR
jgi:hypothetical protein